MDKYVCSQIFSGRVKFSYASVNSHLGHPRRQNMWYLSKSESHRINNYNNKCVCEVFISQRRGQCLHMHDQN